MNVQTARTANCSKIFVFKTSLQTKLEVQLISGMLNNTQGIEEWSVDLDDWESILRIKSDGITATEVLEILHRVGINSKELEM